MFNSIPAFSVMGSNAHPWLILLFWVLLILSPGAHCDSPEPSVKLLRTPPAFSNSNSATFAFEALMVGNGEICTNCAAICKLDDQMHSDCEGGEVSYTGLQDGDHTFEVCAKAARGFGCANYNWTIDTIPPTAYVTAATSFTNAPNVSVDITFSEPCTGGGGFGCSSVNACNLLVYRDGQVLPTTLNILQPNLKFSLVVSLSSNVQYGRAILVMDKHFCSDRAGNRFTRTANSSFLVHFDRRSVFVNLRTHVPQKLLQLNRATRTVQATNSYRNLKVYLYFSAAIVNSSAEILKSLHISQGSLSPISGSTLGNRRFGFLVEDISIMAIVTVSLDNNLLISRHSTPVSAVAPVTFLYDAQRPAVRLRTTSKTRTTENSIPILIKFMKPVFGFNASHVSISGGRLQSFHEVSRTTYVAETQADGNVVSISVPENVTGDVAGNENLPSNVLRVRHYSVPMISLVLSTFVNAAFAVTCLVAGLLTVSTASLQSIGAFSGPSSLTSDPARNLFRIACHFQVIALSRWLAVTLPIEYYEFARGLQWSIPCFSLPWETGSIQQVMVGSSSPAVSLSDTSEVYDFGIIKSVQPKEEYIDVATPVYGSPLTSMEYRSFFESENMKPEAEYILDPHNLNGWRDFNRSMFWLAVIGGGLVLLHAFLLLILKLNKKKSEKQKRYGALVFPRFEIFIVIIALPCISEASAALVKGGASSGLIVGILLLTLVSFLLLALFLFLSIGITYGKLLQYKEVHQVGQRFHWYQEIVRVTLGPGKRGQWTWKNQAQSAHLTRFGPLFEDLRGPPKYMLSQIAGGNPPKHGDRIIASDDENEDTEAPIIQKLFGILRIYYTLLESIRRVYLGIVAGAYSNKWTTKTPTITLLCITSFQLFFMVLKKPFIKKKVQLVEIISLSSEVGIFATCVFLLQNGFSTGDENYIGIFLLSLFLAAFMAQMINEWYALYRQTRQFDPAEKSFLQGLKTASIGFVLFFVPHKLIKNLDSMFPQKQRGEGENGASSVDRQRSSGSGNSCTTDKPWLNQLRELAQASFSKEGSGALIDPSTSRSGFWSGKRSNSSSMTSSSDFKSRPKALYKDLEAIFASK